MKPILFNTEMVRAILEGRKTVTRRVVKPQPAHSVQFMFPANDTVGADWRSGGEFVWYQCPPLYLPGDILYVRETWDMLPANERAGIPVVYWYRADIKKEDENPDDRWFPSIHMPKEAARLFLRVTNVWVERLQDISGDACAAEGIPLYAGPVGGREEHYRTAFASLWDSTIKPADLHLYGWDADPWVWVIEFERISREEALKGGDPDGAV